MITKSYSDGNNMKTHKTTKEKNANWKSGCDFHTTLNASSGSTTTGAGSLDRLPTTLHCSEPINHSMNTCSCQNNTIHTSTAGLSAGSLITLPATKRSPHARPVSVYTVRNILCNVRNGYILRKGLVVVWSRMCVSLCELPTAAGQIKENVEVNF